jgi:hypothetical protein
MPAPSSGFPGPPLAIDWNRRLPVDLGAMRNDQIGDCVFAAMGHAHQTWTGAALGNPITPTDDDVVRAYSICTGYNPAVAGTDNGAVILVALNHWRRTGIGGRRIDAYCAVNFRDLRHVQAAIDLFGGILVGAAMPRSAQRLDWTGKVNPTGDDAPGTWGGHGMWCPTYDHLGPGFVTWGHRQRADWQWWNNYVDEAYVALSPEWTARMTAPNGFDYAKLLAYIASL